MIYRTCSLSLIVFLAGCSTSSNVGTPISTGDLTPPATATTKAGGTELDVYVDNNGGAHVENWLVAHDDWSALVTQRHVTSAVIRGGVASNFGDALKVQAELHHAGVANVTIADSSN